MAASGGLWAPIAMRVFKHTFKKTSNLIKDRVAGISRPFDVRLEHVLVRSTPRQPLHPIARLRQSKGRWYTTHSTVNAALRRFMSTGSIHIPKTNRASFPRSATASAVSRLTSQSPFNSTLRPNLTGGALPRTAGGYGFRSGGARYFSHTTAQNAQVVNNVSAAVRAFWLSGQKAQFDGMSPAGEKIYRNVSSLQEETDRKWDSISRSAPGSFITFDLTPTITALSPLGLTYPSKSTQQASTPTLNTEGFLDVLSIDFSRALRDLAAIMNDLKRLSSLGDLPISLENPSMLVVRFPGCDAETVEQLCDEMGVHRGVIHQDTEFDKAAGTEMALKFPFAATTENSLSSPGGSLRSQTGHNFNEFDDEDIDGNPGLEGYESMGYSSGGESAYFTKPSEHQNSSDYEGLEGIYRFLEQCDNSRRI